MKLTDKIGVLVLTLTFLFFSSAASAQMCVNKEKIIRIMSGQVEEAMGSDGGNAVYVQTQSKDFFPLNKGRNLNDPMGPALLAQLTTAMSLGLKVSLIDHNGTKCDDFDEIYLHAN